MALLFMDSFDHYATADLATKWNTTANGSGVIATIAAAGGRRGSGSFRLTATGPGSSANCYVQKTFAPVDPTTCVIGCAHVMSASNLVGASGMPLASLRDTGTTQLTLRVNNDLSLSVVRGPNNGTVLGTTSAGLSAGTVAYVEWKAVIHPSAGTVEVRINGVVRLLLTAQNTRTTANSSWNSLSLGIIEGLSLWAGNNGTIDWDDLYVLDGSGSAPLNTFLGDCRVDARYPTGAGATTGWTPSAGANWAAVDDAAPNGDTDYVASTTTGTTDTYVTQDAAVVGATIYGLQHCLSLKKSDAGVCTVAPVIRLSGGPDSPGADLSPGTSYAYGLQIAATQPGGAAWTEAAFNAAEFGVKRTT